MLLFVGLGNPTPDSENNRHNVGFKIIDSINKKFGLSKQKPKFKGLLTTGNVGDQKIYAIKPLTFMNNSGICIRELIEYFKIDAEDVIVFHDDLDVEFGKIKAKFGGSSAGHNGIAEVCAACHSMKYLSYRNLGEKGGPEFSEAETKAIAASFEVTDGPNADGEMFERPATY